MDDRLRIIAEHSGVFLRFEALDVGYDDRTLKRSLRAGVIKRVRHGAYCYADQWNRATAEQKHLILAKAVARTTPGPIAFSHTTALLLHGIPVWGADLSRVHLTRLDKGAFRTRPDVSHHVTRLHAHDLTELDGQLTTIPRRAVLEAGCLLSTESALVSADAALHLGLCTPDDLHETFSEVTRWPGSQRLQIVVRMADGRRESPGESRSAFMFWRYGLPCPEFQWEIYDETGRLAARVDFAWPEYGVLGEFDGKVKYGRLLRPGQDPGGVVFDEKTREDFLRELTGYLVRRLTWSDLSRPHETVQRFARALKVSCCV